MDAEPSLFPELVDTEPPLSRDAARTARQKAMLASGVHPATRYRLLSTFDATCGDCANLVTHHHNLKTFYKCGLVKQTSGAGTDIRLSWPACTAWASDGR